MLVPEPHSRKVTELSSNQHGPVTEPRSQLFCWGSDLSAGGRARCPPRFILHIKWNPPQESQGPDQKPLVTVCTL